MERNQYLFLLSSASQKRAWCPEMPRVPFGTAVVCLAAQSSPKGFGRAKRLGSAAWLETEMRTVRRLGLVHVVDKEAKIA